MAVTEAQRLLRSLQVSVERIMVKQTSEDRNDTTLQHPEQWKTGDEPATTAQRSYLETLTREANEEWDPDQSWTKSAAAVRIEELQKKTGRGQG